MRDQLGQEIGTRWIDDQTTDEPFKAIEYRKLNLRRRGDRKLSAALRALLHETSYCRVEGCRVIAAGVKGRGHVIRVQIRHHKWCLAGRSFNAKAGKYEQHEETEHRF